MLSASGLAFGARSRSNVGMKRIRQHRLRKGPPGRGRIVEVDLVEVEAQGVSATGKGYLVPYRSGREGQPLQEGTRTTLPVSMERAERILARELQRRRDDGYVEVGDPDGGLDPQEPTLDLPLSGRARTLLSYIQRPGYAPAGRRRSRIVQRVGDLRIHEATSALVSELATATGTHRIVLAGALARVASAECAGALHVLAKDDNETVRRFATFGLLQIPGEASAIRQHLLDELPGGIARSIDSESQLDIALASWLQRPGPERPLVLVSLYQLYTPAIRAVLLRTLATLRLGPPTWRAVRRIYKLAELRDDGDILGVLIHAIESNRAQPGTGWMYTWTRERGRVNIVDEIRSGSDRFGFTVATRKWFRKRARRTLARRGFDASPAYVDLALGLLAAVDGKPSPYASLAVQLVLRANRHGLHATSLEPAPRSRRSTRHEAFPELWDARPDALVKLALGGYTDSGIAMGCEALADCADLHRHLTIEQVVQLASASRSDQRELGLRGARAHWNPEQPNRDLLLALANSPDEVARNLALGWIRDVAGIVLADPSFLAALLLSERADTRARAAQLLDGARTIPGVEAALITTLLDRLRALPVGDAHTPVVADLLTLFTGPLASVMAVWPYDTLATLFDATRTDVCRLGAQLLAAHTVPAEDLPAALLARWTAHPDPEVRKHGITTFGRLPDVVLVEKVPVLVAMLSSPVPQVRAAIAPTVIRLSKQPTVALEVWDLLLALIVRDDVDEPVQVELAEFAGEHLAGQLDRLTDRAVFRLLDAPGAAAQTLGATMLGRLTPGALTPAQVVALADNDMRLVRATAQAWTEAEPERILADDVQLLRLIDAAWPDTRALGARLMRTVRPPDVLDPALLVAICDSPRAEVQRLGRQLIPELFQREFGPLLLARLSEHPSVAMQAFVSGLLHSQAAGHSDRIRALAPYFASVLGGVSRGGVAKARVFDFLRTELARDPELVPWALPLLERASGSASIQDRARAIAILSAARRAHGIESSVVTVVAPTHRGEARDGV